LLFFFQYTHFQEQHTFRSHYLLLTFSN
jgi:hypothetical protein